MANENEIVISAKLDIAELEKQLKQFSSKFRDTLESNLSGDKGVSASDLLNQKSIDKATNALKAHRAALIDAGLTHKEADSATRKYATALDKLQASLDTANRVQRVNGGLNEREISRLRLNRAAVDDLTAALTKLGTAHAKSNVEIKRGEAFMESFGFRVGILGFGFGILGGHLQRFSQLMLQGVQSGAKLIEPLERIQNLLFQDPEIGPGQAGGILGELNRLADFPGSTLETTAKTFRSLQTLGLEVADTLKLLEGLTKATARSGIGAEGLDRIAAQLRDFMSTGALKQQEVRSIISAGGKDVANIFATQFGGTNAETLNKIGPEKVIRVLIDELAKLPTPLETVTDKLNKMQNAVTRLALAIAPLIKPGLDGLLKILHSLIPVVTSLSEKFQQMPQGIQDLITTLLVLTPTLAAVTAGIFTLISALAILIAASKQVRDVFRDTRGILFGTEETAGKLTGTFRAAGTEVTLFGTIAARAGGKIKAAFIPVIAVFTTLIASLKRVSAASGNTVGFATGIGAGSRFFEDLSKLAFFAKGTFAAGLTAITTSLGGILRILPRILGLTGPVGLLINTLLALITNAGHARDVVKDAFTGLGESISNLIEKLNKLVNTDLVKTIGSVITALTNLIGGVLGAALASVITQLTVIVDLLADIVGFIESPSWANFATILEGLIEAIIGGAAVLGALIAAAILDAIAEALKGTRLGALLGTDELTNVAAGIREGVKNAFNKQPIDAATDSVDTLTNAFEQFNDELDETDKLLDNLEKGVNKLTASFGKMLTDLTNKQLRFQLSLQAQQAERDFDRFAAQDPDAALAQLNSFLSGQASTARQGVRAAGGAQLKNVSQDLDRVLKRLSGPGISKDSVLGAFLGTDFTDAMNRFVDALRQINNLAKSGDVSLESYKNAIVAIEGTGKVLQDSLLGANFDSGVVTPRGKISGDRGKAQSKILDRILTDTLGTVGKLQDAIKEQAEEEQNIDNNIIRQKQEKLQLIEDLIKAINAETTAQTVRLQIQEKENALALEEERVQNLIGRGEVADLTKINSLREEIVKLRTQEATIANIHKAKLEQLRIENQKDLETEQNKLKATQDRIKALKELSKIQEDQFRNSLDNLRTFISESKQGFTDLATAPGLGDFIKKAETNIRTLVNFENLLSTEVRDTGQRLTAADFRNIMPVTADTQVAALRDNIAGRDLNHLKATMDVLINASAELDAKLNDANEKQLALEKSGDNTSKEYLKQVETVNELTAEGLSYARLIAFVNALLKQRTKTLDDETTAQIRTVELARNEAQWRQEILELQLETIQLQAQQAAQQARQGDLGLGGMLGGIVSRRTQSNKAEIDLIKQKYVLLKSELEIRRLNLLAQMKLSKATQSEIDAMNALFATRKKILEENEQLETTITTNVDKLDTFTRKLYDIADAFNQVFSAARDARQAMSDFFSQAASGEFVLDALYKGLTEGISATDLVATAFTTMAAVISEAFIRSIRDGEDFLEVLSGLIGGILIKIGEMLIQMAAAAVVAAFLDGLFFGGGVFAGLAAAAAVAPWAALAAGIGAGLIAAGVAMGGAGRSTSRENTTVGADKATGAQRNTFEPNKDPRFVFQKTMLATIQLEIKTDDSQIIKAVINGVNQNGRLTRLIGNRKLEFTV